MLNTEKKSIACSPLPLYSHQVEAVTKLIDNKGNFLIADEMGLGKTIQVLVYINYLFRLFDSKGRTPKVLIIAPMFLLNNWEREISKWFIENGTVSYFHKNQNSDILLINYAKLTKFHKELVKIKWDLVVVDESHYVKNSKAKRTKVFIGMGRGKERTKGIKDVAKKIILMTGTPILNKPYDLWTPIRILGWDRQCYDDSIPKEKKHFNFRNWKAFTTTYCNPYNNGFGMSYNGAENLDDLKKGLNKYNYLRREKKEVLDLPEKIRQIINLKQDSVVKNILKEQKEYIKDYEDFKAKEKSLIKTGDVGSLAKTRAELALHKAQSKEMKTILTNFYESNNNRLIVFGHHREPLKYLSNTFEDSYLIIGGLSAEEKTKRIDAWREKGGYLFMSIGAGAEGLTLTESSMMIFIELDWRPSINIQAEDRIHRVGQKKTCNYYYLLYQDSIDYYVAVRIGEKQHIINQVITKREVQND